MTCIVGLVEEGTGEKNVVYMGGDRAYISGYKLLSSKNPKVFSLGIKTGESTKPLNPMLIGCSGSVRMMQILQYELDPIPPHPAYIRVEGYFIHMFVAWVKNVFKEYSFKMDDGDVFLAGYQGQLFRVHQDLSVHQREEKWDAIGAGADIALGSLFSTTLRDSPDARVTEALEAAATFCCGVKEPFDLLSV